jgi:hypothetical protein
MPTLRDASVDPLVTPTRRSLANASIGIEAFDAYYSARELYEALQGVFQGTPGAKNKLTQVLSCQCDDYQRCLYYTLAGRGIVHSERTDEERRRQGQRLFGLQTWVALPEAQEEGDPAFVHHGAEALPIIEEGGVKARLIAGAAFGARSPLATASETLYADVQLDPGARLAVEPSVTERALYTISGEIEVAGQSFAPAQLLVLRPEDQILVRARSAARIMLFGGEPMDGPRWIWWNFASSRKERIEQAQEEWRRGRFDTVPGDEADFIPLPETNTKPRRALGGVFYP